MFSADLSYLAPQVEKVGVRRARKEREQARSLRSSQASVAPDTHPPRSPSYAGSKGSKTSSSSNERETWWPATLRKAKAKLVSTKSTNNLGLVEDQEPDYPQTGYSPTSNSFKDPKLHPGWTVSSSLRSTLPSGAPLDDAVNESPGSEWKRERLEKLTGPNRLHPIRQSSKSFMSQTTSKTTITSRMGSPESTEGTYPAETHARLRLCDDSAESAPQQEESWPLPSGIPHRSAVRPQLTDVVVPSSDRTERNETPLTAVAPTKDGIQKFTRFTLFIKRMQNSGPKMIVERLKEEWPGSPEEGVDEEWRLEKQLWLLTAFQLQTAKLSGTLRPTSPALAVENGKMLELHGDLAEVYQLAAMHPEQTIHYLTTHTQHKGPLPANVSLLAIPIAETLPFPYPSGSFSHIRASTLPSLVPSSKLPQIFRECHRLLSPGGMLEIRIMDASPVRRTSGPKMRAWIEDRVSLSLEREFRCSKPCLLVPNWVEDAGFELHGGNPSLGGHMRMPCAFAEDGDVESELQARIGRALWRDIWGAYVEEVEGEPKWWWQDEEVVQECLEFGTVFECGALFAFKR